jgi:hypothetical protein
VSELDGTNGFALQGLDYSSRSVSTAGDVNGDGFGDLIVGARNADSNGTDAGASYVIFGKANGFAASLNVSALDGVNGFKLSGVASYDHSGISVSGAGDVNGDGFDDIIIGAYEANPNGYDSGASYVVFGKAGGFAANLNLSTLNGSNGFKMSGVALRDYAGISVSSAGDVNGDGFDDVIIGAFKADANGNDSGASYVVFGKGTGFFGNLNLSTLDGSNGFKLSGVAAGDRAGGSVSGGGDVNGDGFDDVIIGAFGAASSGIYSGASYVVFGKASGFVANINLTSLNGFNGFKLDGTTGSRLGYSVSGAGDFNGDGFDDLIIGKLANYGGTYGASYLVFGKAGGFAPNFNVSALNGSNGFKLNGAAPDDHFGHSVSAAGDVNGDGFGDLIIGAPKSDFAGASYVVFGSALGPFPEMRISDASVKEPLTGTTMASFTVTLSSPSSQAVTVQYQTANDSAVSPEDYTATALSTLAFAPGETSKTVLVEINADTRTELGETFFINLVNPMGVVVRDGQGLGMILDKVTDFQLSIINGLNGSTITGAGIGDRSGISVSDAGDVNGDGYGDVIIGADQARPNGASYVVFGRASGFGSVFNVSALNGSNGFRLNGVADSDDSGASVSAAGDVNGDGFGDVIIGAPNADPNGASSGEAYVVFGKAGGFTPNLNLTSLDGSNGFALRGGGVDERAGSSVSAAGDVNGDGFDDVMVGASGASPNGAASGASYIVFGKANGFAPALNLSSLNGSNGFTLNGVAAFDVSGRPISGAGDVNGDGFSDVIVGAYHASPNGQGSGAVYVVLGKQTGFAPTLNLATLNGNNGFRLSGGNAGDYAGRSVSAAGDVNGDGFADIIVGAESAGPGSGPGRARPGESYVVFGKAGGFAPDMNLSTLDGSNGFKLSGIGVADFSGASVSSAGDFNGDGFDDLIIGAPGLSLNGRQSGGAYIAFGRGGGFSADTTLASLIGRTGFKLYGVAAYDRTGQSVSAAGDVNGDGFDDVIIGAFQSDRAVPDGGASYVIFGRGVEVHVSDTSAIEGDEGAGKIQFTLTLSEEAINPVTVTVRAVGGSAVSGSDFAPLDGATVMFAPGETSKVLAIDLIGDRLFESDETFSIVLSTVTGGVIRDGTGIGIIQNDDAPPFVSVVDGSLLEGNSEPTRLIFTATLSEASGLPATVRIASADGTALAGSDYLELTPTTLTFAPGETTKTIEVEVLGDSAVEDHESFSVILSDASSATIGEGTAVGTIFNDDTTIRLNDSTSGVEGDAGTTPFVFTISLEKPSALPVTVNYATVNGTANASSDFQAISDASISFAPGEVLKTVSIAVVGDQIVEAHETFSLLLFHPENANVMRDIGTATILNDDSLIRISDAAVLEGHSGVRPLTFMVSLVAPSALPVSVNFATADGSAIAGNDYIAVAGGVLDFAPGETSKNVTIDVLGDTIVDVNEKFSVLLSTASNAVIDDPTGLGTILDDDVTLRSKRLATFPDVDGDFVRIKVSKGTLKVDYFTLLPSGSGSQLALVDFNGDTKFAGANLSITADRAPGTPRGVRLVDVGAIDASGIDLGKIVIHGDLGQIDAGNDLDSPAGVRSLTVQSLGMRGVDTQLPGGSMQSNIAGALKMLKVTDSIHDADIFTGGDIGSVKIKSDVLGSAIRSGGKIGSMKVTGDLAASENNTTIISARGVLGPAKARESLAIGGVLVGGSVVNARILAGYDSAGAAVNADVSIGAVMVRGDWRASDLAAGVAAGPDSVFGTDDDALISGENAVIARIVSILISGTTAGTEGGGDHFGFVAEQIAAVKANGVKVSLTPGPSNDTGGVSVGPTGDVKIREAA